MIATQLASIGLRIVALTARFLLMIMMARLLSPHELGLYALVYATVAFSVYVLGMDFHFFSARELTATSKQQLGRLFRNQLVFHGVVYLVLLPALLLLFTSGMLPWYLAGWFYGILILEHISQEIYRLFVILGRPTTANFVLLLRSGAWVYAVVVTMAMNESAQSLTTIWLGWSLGAGASVLVAVPFAHNILKHATPWDHTDRTWILGGLMQLRYFVAASLALRGVEYMDRYIIELYLGTTQLGVYSVYVSMASFVQAFVYSGVLAIFYPRVIASFKERAFAEHGRTLNQMWRQAVIATVTAAGIAALAFDPVLRIIDKPIYQEFAHAYWLLLVGTALTVIALVPHYALYARHHDKSLLYSSLSAFAAALLSNLYLVPQIGLNGAATAQIVGGVVALTIKAYLVHKWTTHPEQRCDQAHGTPS